MLTTISQVNEEFFRLFFNLQIKVNGESKTIRSRYARKSSFDYVEEDDQIYPCIVIQDFAPVPKEEWYIEMRSYFGGKSLDGLTGYLYQRPIWMNFRYDVSIATKSYKEYVTLQDYFTEKFVYGKQLLFNKKLCGDDAVGDVVAYDTRVTDVPRTDGVFETNYEFTLSPWIYPKEPKEITLIQDIVINGSPKNL